jgi:hypothetical protein
VTKLTIAERMELLALFEPFTHSTGAAVSGNRPREVFAGMQAVTFRVRKRGRQFPRNT